MDSSEPSGLKLDDETLSFVKAVHKLKSAGAPVTAYEKLRDGLFIKRHRISTHFLTLAEVIAAAIGPNLPNNAAWKEFQAIVDAEYTLEAIQVGAGGKRKRSRDESTRVRGFVKLAALWSMELAQYYRLDLASQRQMRLLCKCATHYLDFVNDFVPAANSVLLARQRQALHNNRIAPIGRTSTTARNAASGMWCPLILSDLQALVDLIDQDHVEVYGQSLQLSNATPFDQTLWTSSVEGDIPVRDGRTLRSFRPHHFTQYLLQQDDYGLLQPRDPASKHAGDQTLSNCQTRSGNGASSNGHTSAETPQPLEQTFPPAENRTPPMEEPNISPKSGITARAPSNDNSPSAPILAPLKTPSARSNVEEEDIHMASLPQEGALASPNSASMLRHPPSPPYTRHGSQETSGRNDTLKDPRAAWQSALTPQCLIAAGLPPTGDGPVGLASLRSLPHTPCTGIPARDSLLGGGITTMLSTPTADQGLLIDPQSNRSDGRLCSVCQSQCSRCHVPKELEQAEADQLHTIAHDAYDMVQDMSLLSSSWMTEIRFASAWNFSLEDSASPTDVLGLSWAEFEERAQRNEPFDRPTIITETFTDSSTYSPVWYARMVESTYAKRVIPVLEGHTTTSTSVRADKLAHALLGEEGTEDLNVRTGHLADLTGANKPGVTRIHRFTPFLRCARRSIHTEESDKSRNCHSGLDFGTALNHNNLSFPGAFSGAQCNVIGGGWTRVLFGRQIWWFVPHNEMTLKDWNDFASQGPQWDPKGKARAIVVEKDDVVFLPHERPVVYATLTLETTLVNGGVLWDESSLDSLLACLERTARSSDHALDLVDARSLSAAVKELPEVLKLDESSDHVKRIRALVSSGMFGCPLQGNVDLCADQRLHDSGVALSEYGDAMETETGNADHDGEKSKGRSQACRSESSSEWSSESSDSDGEDMEGLLNWEDDDIRA